jgi:hypothetical protein
VDDDDVQEIESINPQLVLVKLDFSVAMSHHTWGTYRAAGGPLGRKKQLLMQQAFSQNINESIKLVCKLVQSVLCG